MDKVTKQRDPKQQAAGRKGYEKYMTKLKKDILKNVGNDSSSNSTNGSIDTTTTTTTTTNDGTNTTSTTTNDGTNTTSTTANDGTNTTSTTTSSGSTTFSYIHGVGAIAVLVLGVCIFIIPKLMTNQTTSQPQNKSPEKISKIRRKML